MRLILEEVIMDKYIHFIFIYSKENTKLLEAKGKA